MDVLDDVISNLFRTLLYIYFLINISFYLCYVKVFSLLFLFVSESVSLIFVFKCTAGYTLSFVYNI